MLLTQQPIFESILWTILTMVIIWRASDGFETASEYIGRHLTDGVRGATINAIASSIPELFTTIFFLLLLKDADGFAGGVGTTAGSAIFNGMIIPALVVITVILSGVARSIEISRRVILRDGISLILCELVLILVLSSYQLQWWHGLLLMILYFIYVGYMLRAMRKRQGNREAEEDLEEATVPAISEHTEEAGDSSWLRALIKLDLADLIIGQRPINNRNAWTLLLVSTAVIAAACAILVYACESFGKAVGFPIYFVAVIIAAAATSVPDTIISMRDGMRGNYDDAVSNAIGSNIFDICFALGLPLFLYTAVYGPIDLPAGSEVGELRLILLMLTVLALLIYIVGKKMALIKAGLLIVLYLAFTTYIISKGLGSVWALRLSDGIQHVLSVVEKLF